MSSKLRSFRLLTFVGLAVVVAACSSEKKGALPRAYHSFVSYFNGFYNAQVRYKDGMKMTEKEIVIPEEGFLIPGQGGGADAANSGAFGLFDEAIVKCDHILFRHKNGSWCDDSWLMKGKCSYQKGNLTEAKVSLETAMNKYPDTKLKPLVLLWLAKCYYAEGNPERANQLVLEAGSAGEVNKKMRPEMAQLTAAVFIQDKKYNEAIGVLNENLRYVKGRKMKSAWHFLLAQLYDAVGDFPRSYENYQSAIKINQYNQMTFRAKLAIAQLYVKYQPQDADPNVIGKTLSQLLKDKKFEDYRDQIYYQYAQLELKHKNDKKALYYLKASIAAGGANKTQLTRSYYESGKIYFYKLERLDSAQAYFDSAARVVPEKFAEYDQVKTLAATLKQYSDDKRIIRTQDSLLVLAKLSDPELKKKIEKIVADEEKKRLEAIAKKQQDDARRMNQQIQIDNERRLQVDPTQVASSGFYFDDKPRVTRGQGDFQRIWGKRAFEDNWRRRDKQATARTEEDLASNYLTPEDSAKKMDQKKAKYFKQVPRGDSAIAAANDKLRNALFDISQLYYQKLAMPDSAVIYYMKVINRYGDTESAPKAYYAIYNLHVDAKNTAEAERVKQIILTKYPESVYARLIKKENVADVLNKDSKAFIASYKRLYDDYMSDRFSEVVTASAEMLTKYNNYPDVSQVYYIRGASFGRMDMKDSLISVYSYLVRNFPDTEEAKVAKKTLELLKKQGGAPTPPNNGGNPRKSEEEAVKEGDTTAVEENKPKSEEEIFKGFVPRRPNEPLNVIVLVDKSKIPMAEVNSLFADFQKKNFSSDGLQTSPFNYVGQDKKEYWCIYVRGFKDFNVSGAYVTLALKDEKIAGLIENKETDIFFLSSANFRTALSKKRFDDYGKYFQKYKDEIVKGSK